MYPDIQGLHPNRLFKLTRVGVTKVKKPITIKRGDSNITLLLDLDIFVDLPASKKGSDMSRNLEIISEIIEESVKKPYKGLELLAENIVKKLLEKHDYANFSEVVMSSDYFLEKKNPSGKISIERYKLIADAKAIKNKNIQKMIGVEVMGITSCPCAMESIRSMFKEKYPEQKDFIEKIPIITHNQRNITTLMIEVPEGCCIEADDLIDIVEDSVSAPTYEILKREDESKLVLDAHKKPRFVEDVVREVLQHILEKYNNLPDDVELIVKNESIESIHKHNAFAERITTLGELRGK